MWRRAGLEVEAIPGPPLPEAQPIPTGLCGGHPRTTCLPLRLPAALGDAPRRAPAGTLSFQMRVERRFLWEETGCVQKRERAIIALINPEAHVRSIV